MRKGVPLIKAKVIKKLSYNKMLLHCFTGCSTVMFKQNQNSKIYLPKVGNGIEDYALFLEVLKQSKNALGYSECLTKYRVHTNSLSGNKLNKIKKISYFYDVMMRLQKKNILMASFYLFTNQFIKYVWKYKKS
ncbi:hypothetical protein FACS1894147_04920 [Spirochaetia bacterium]|nr:hypothetical protein FACS1894147_04920 [Spirochaetia bacterium]